MAHLKAKATRRDKFSRLQWKLRLVRGLYERGYERQDILELFRFIDWVMRLPEDLEDRFDEEISRYQEEQQMPYITSIERRAMARGELQGRLETAREAVIEVLETRFEVVPQSMVEVINELNDLSVLKSLLRQAATIASLSEFRNLSTVYQMSERLIEELEDNIQEEISRYQEEQQMPYITSIERRAWQGGNYKGDWKVRERLLSKF
jgi:vacuolar-type H+-ATPase subunit F/Vma7